MKIATWNVNSLRVRQAHVLDWLDQEQPDVLGLQETKIRDEDFPAAVFEERGYHAVASGQRTYNGVALLSKLPPESIVRDLDDFEDVQRRVIGATIGGVRVYNLYVPNGQNVESEKYIYKLEWMEALRAHLTRERELYPDTVLIGDFNIAPEDRDVHDPEAWEGKVHCSGPERAALQRLLDSGFVDVFRRLEQPERSFSWWDYRAAAFRRNLGLRIDLILATERLADRVRRSWIDVGPRRLERPSDHAPVVAEFE